MGQWILVVFRRRSSALRPVNRIKHVLDVEGTLLQSGAVVTVPLATVVAVRTDPINPVEVEVGSTVNGFFLSVFVVGATGAPLGTTSVNWLIGKKHSGQSLPAPTTVGTSDLRNQIVHEEKGLAGSGDGTPMAFKGVVGVPRGMRRNRSGDQWELKLSLTASATADAVFCVKAIYNSYF